MLDDLRNSSSFLDEEEKKPEEQAVRKPMARRRRQKTFLGMTAQQRFLLSLALFVMVCILGSFALVISGSVYLPF